MSSSSDTDSDIDIDEIQEEERDSSIVDTEEIETAQKYICVPLTNGRIGGLFAGVQNHSDFVRVEMEIRAYRDSLPLDSVFRKDADVQLAVMKEFSEFAKFPDITRLAELCNELARASILSAYCITGAPYTLPSLFEQGVGTCDACAMMLTVRNSTEFYRLLDSTNEKTKSLYDYIQVLVRQHNCSTAKSVYRLLKSEIEENRWTRLYCAMTDLLVHYLTRRTSYLSEKVKTNRAGPFILLTIFEASCFSFLVL